LDVLPLLDKLRQPATQISGMDSSDGLADAIVQICRASGVGAIVDRGNISIDPARSQFAPATALESALYGGEDFELVLCMPESIATQLVSRLNQGAAIIGRITQQLEILVVDAEDRSHPINLDLRSGFQHFA
jgi:thiamine-monophosphate kinase